MLDWDRLGTVGRGPPSWTRRTPDREGQRKNFFKSGRSKFLKKWTNADQVRLASPGSVSELKTNGGLVHFTGSDDPWSQIMAKRFYRIRSVVSFINSVLWIFMVFLKILFFKFPILQILSKFDTFPFCIIVRIRHFRILLEF